MAQVHFERQQSMFGVSFLACMHANLVNIAVHLGQQPPVPTSR